LATAPKHVVLDVIHVATGNRIYFEENGVIVRNLNYRPWQWYIAFPVAKVFLAVFNKLIE
jgi:hypothetical protein